MSTTTDKLALFKYDPSTDGAQTFNIKKALNDNWDKLDDAVKEILITLAKKADLGEDGKVPTDQLPDMDYAPSNHTQSASTITAGTFAGKVRADPTARAVLTDYQLRDISAGSTDMTAGSTPLSNGLVYLVYE